MSTPETDRVKRKAALKAARQKLALRKKQREELRAQRTARLGGKFDVLDMPVLTRRLSLKKQTSLLSFIDDIDTNDDIKENEKARNTTSLLRKPGKRRTLSIARTRHYNFIPQKTVITWDKATETELNMFCECLMEQFGDEFPDSSSITDEVKGNLMESKYKMGWPKEVWIHEKSLSPAPQIIMSEYDETRRDKIAALRKQEMERKQRQFELIKHRRKMKLEKRNRNILPMDEANTLIRSGRFLANLQQKTKWIERTLGINNYNTNTNKYRNKNKEKNKKQLLSYNNTFGCDETQNRAICDINFCATNSDWFLASYYLSEPQMNSINEMGLILIWNLILPRFPEYKLYSESQITSCHFHPMNKFLVFGATTSGQILCYDLRTGSNSKPVQRTNFNDSHCSAIYCMDFLHSNTKSDNNKQRTHILSVSNDGKLCIFRDDALHLEAMHHGILSVNDETKYIGSDGDKEQMVGGSSTSQELSTVCFGYQHKRSDHIIFGTDSGRIYRTDIHSKHSASNQDAIYVEQCVEAHFGPITNIHFPSFDMNNNEDNNMVIPSSISGLYLTSSYDWTVKLWHNDYVQEIETYTSMTDYVYDVKWCNGGKHGIFACCDGSHNLTLFDLKYDLKEPLNIIKVPVDGNQPNAALTKFNWSNNAKYLCCGDSNGQIYLYLSSSSLLNPQQNDIDNLDKAITSTIKSRQLTKQSK